MSSQLIALSDALAKTTESAAAHLVAVHTEARGSHSGVTWRTGLIVTSEHALQRDDEIHVTLPDARVVRATLAGRDSSTDLALLKCPEATAPARIASDTNSLKPGSLALVVGRTRASGPVAALGVVSLVAPERRMWTGAALAPYIRLDVGLQPTAIGGAVVDARGEVAGIVTPRFGRFGITLIPAATVNRIVDTLLQKGRIPRGYLGVGLQPVRLPENLRGALQRDQKTAAIVLEVEPNSPAQKSGIVIGDILVALAGHPVTRMEDVQSELHADNIGRSLAAKVLRGGVLQDLTLAVAERPSGAN
jgi:S1-C subfamily serine protease